MAETVIFEEQSITTAYYEQFGLYVCPVTPAPFPLAIGEKYKVVWDGQSYEVEAIDSSAVTGYAAIGNGTSFGFSGNDEPFIVLYTSNNAAGSSDISFVALTDTESTEHTVAIYHVVADPEGIILKDRNGNDVAYYGIETVTFDTTTEGKQQVYTKGTKAEKTVALDMSGGDQSVEPDTGTLLGKLTVTKPETLMPENIRSGVTVGGIGGTFIGDTETAEVALSMAEGDQVISPSAEGKVLSSVTVAKPETLIPENIAEGVDIAGIIGTFAGGSEVIMKGGTFSGNGGTYTLNHNLGMIPDVFILFITGGTYSSGMSSGTTLTSVYGVSSKMKEQLGISRGISGIKVSSSTGIALEGSTLTLNDNTSRPLSNVTENTITIGARNYVKLASSSTTYSWFAIGGLT